MRILSPAKINFRLEILKKRRDGYHEIRGIFQKINLMDEIEISITSGEGITIYTTDPELSRGEDNLVFRAAQLLLSSSKIKIGLIINIYKKIPIAAGLGGGSSNAASVLKALNQMMQLNLSFKTLMDFGRKLGADVPFFLYPGGTALVTGIGEKLEEMVLEPKPYLVLVNPGIPISTAYAYKEINRVLTKKRKNTINIPTKIEGLNELIPLLTNDFEEVIFSQYPEIKEIKERLLMEGAEASLMTGSGSTVFGIFKWQREALRAYQRLESLTHLKVFMSQCL